jgi:transposase
LGLVLTRDGGIPLSWQAYPGEKPDLTQFAMMIDQLRKRHATVCDAAGAQPAGMTVVFDAGQSSEHNFAHLALEWPALHRLGTRVGLPGADRPARHRPQRHR